MLEIQNQRNEDSKVSSAVKSTEKYRLETANKEKRISIGGSDIKPLNNLNYDDVFNDYNDSKVLNLSNKINNNFMNNLNNIIVEEDSNFNLMNTLTNNNFKSVYDNINDQVMEDGPLDYHYNNENEKTEHAKKEEEVNKKVQKELIR